MRINMERYTPYLEEILKGDEYKMTTGQLLLLEGEKKGEEKGRQKGMLQGMVQVYYTKLNLKPNEIAQEMKITEDEVQRILIELKLVS